MEPPIPSLREQGVHALREGRLDGAIDLLARAVMAEDSDAEAKAYLGVAYSQKGLHEQAVRALRSAVELQPQNLSHRFNLAVAQERAGDARGAAAEYQHIVQVNPEHAQAKARLQALGSPAQAARPAAAATPSVRMERGGSPLGPTTPGAGQTPGAVPQAGPSGTVKCPKCQQGSRPGLTCERCGGTLPSRLSFGTAPWLQGPTAPAEMEPPSGLSIDAAPEMETGEAFARRLAANFVDSLVIIVFAAVLMAFTFPLISGGAESEDWTDLLSLIVLLVYALYSATMLAWTGQTVGKMALCLRVVGPDGEKPGFWRAMLRESIGKWLSQIFYLGFLWMLWDKRQQTWHDKIARTFVERA